MSSVLACRLLPLMPCNIDSGIKSVAAVKYICQQAAMATIATGARVNGGSTTGGSCGASIGAWAMGHACKGGKGGSAKKKKLFWQQTTAQMSHCCRKHS